MNDKIAEIIKAISPIDEDLTKKAYERIDNLTKPKGSLGRLEEVAAKLFAIFDGNMPVELNKVIYVFAADHGITEEGVSAYPRDVTYQMVFNFLRGGAAINVFSRNSNAKVYVVDMGVDYDFPQDIELINKKIAKGTENFAKVQAMSELEAINSITAGFEIAQEAVKRGYNLLAPGDMGIGNTTSSSAVIKAATEMDTELLVGFGTGIDENTLKRKITVINEAIALHKPIKDDAIDILKKLGGFEIGAICGFVLGAAYYRKPVVIDGFISAAGFTLAWLLQKNVLDYAIFSHCSMERGHKHFFRFIGAKPLLDLNMRLGEGTGSAVVFPIIEAAIRMFNEMATFSRANVSGRLS